MLTLVKSKVLRYMSEVNTSVEDDVYAFQTSKVTNDATAAYVTSTAGNAGVSITAITRDPLTGIVTAELTTHGLVAGDLITFKTIASIDGGAEVIGKYYEVLSAPTTSTFTFYSPEALVNVPVATYGAKVLKAIPAITDLDKVTFVSAMLVGKALGAAAAIVVNPTILIGSLDVVPVNSNLATSLYFGANVVPINLDLAVSESVIFRFEGVKYSA